MNKKKFQELVTNILSLGSIDLIGIVIPIVLMPIISRALGLVLYSEYLLFTTLIVFGHTIIDYGVQYTGVREATRLLGNRQKLKKVYLDYQGVRFLFTILYSLLGLCYFAFTGEIMLMAIFFFLYCLGYFFLSSWFFRSIRKTSLLLYSSVTSKIIQLLLILKFVKNEDDYYLLICFSTVPFFITSILMYLYLRSRFKVGVFEFSRLRKYIFEGFDVFVGLLSPNLYNSIPIIIMGSLGDKIAFSFFMVSYKVCSVIYTFLNVLSSSLYPIVARENSSQLKMVLRLNLLVSIPIIAVIFLSGREIVELILGIELDVDIYLRVISVSLFFVALSNAFSTGFFLPQKLDKNYRDIAISSSILASLTCFAFIYFFGVLGCALGLLFGRGLLSINYYRVYYKLSHTSVSA
ncbi:polysaccharide biosynthesis protein [Vibrio diabolicus E0666]|uniref:oligosaccharide flippase family protein n=1 Tax=Vibrio diabolicus TaxID=50719 RepID=UPI0002B703D8|nr:oligosaccharide flippase family protein [Vibrio diabolicus]EMD78537.1 polysaccharide biosynthesis protein [Vibrio diabolicus E0666]